MIGRTRTSQDKMAKIQSTNIFDTLAPRLFDYVKDLINILDNKSNIVVSSKGAVVTPEYLQEITKNSGDIVNTIIDNCKRKKNLGYVVNEIMSKFQFANMAGFDLVNLFGEFRPIYVGNQKEVKELWHRDMMNVLFNTLATAHLPGSKPITRKMIMMCEEYELDSLPNKFSSSDKKKLEEIKKELEDTLSSDSNILDLIRKHNQLLFKEKSKNTNPNEFETLEIHEDGRIERLTKESINQNIFHNYNIFDDKLVVNIHNGSNMRGPKAIESICNLINKFTSIFPQRHLIICGDSNVYYSKSKMDDITELSRILKEMGFNLLISRYVVTKRRPRNFFQNSQSSEKGFEETVEDTMFVAYPISLQSKLYFDSEKYFIVSENRESNISKMITNTIWAFEGASLGFSSNTEYGWEGVDICNFHEYLFSDHMPIYCDIDGIRLVVSNNVSIKGSRGINYNQDKFNSEINLNELQRISDEVLMPFFITKLRDMIESLIHTESGKSLLSEKSVKEYKKIIEENINWDLLKKLVLLEIN